MTNISCFTVDANGQMFFLRPRGTGSTPTAIVHHGGVRGVRVS
jgi:hypothetical protein